MTDKNIFIMKNEDFDYDRIQFLTKTDGNVEKIYDDALELKKLLAEYYNVRDILPKI